MSNLLPSEQRLDEALKRRSLGPLEYRPHQVYLDERGEKCEEAPVLRDGNITVAILPIDDCQDVNGNAIKECVNQARPLLSRVERMRPLLREWMGDCEECHWEWQHTFTEESYGKAYGEPKRVLVQQCDRCRRTQAALEEPTNGT